MSQVNFLLRAALMPREISLKITHSKSNGPCDLDGINPGNNGAISLRKARLPHGAHNISNQVGHVTGNSFSPR